MKRGEVPIAYLAEALGGYLQSNDPDFPLRQGLSDTLRFNGLDELEKLLDPNHAGPQLSGEPGWSIERQMLRGEVRRAEQHRRQRALRAGLSSDGTPVPGPPSMQEANARRREQALEELNWPLPAEDQGPEATWPPWARFKAELAFPDEFGNPDHPVAYYDSARILQIVEKVMAVYVQHHPEAKARADRIVEHARWWAAHDAGQPPSQG